MAIENKSGFACNKCGASLLGDEPLDGYCLVCLLGTALDQEGPADASGVFDHYRLATHPDGTAVELGRGAMGITYRAFDINLRCPVALKVISKEHLGDELARLRFLREARIAAKLRHSNIASLLHLGRSGRDYFYAMEFVEGETLDSLIKRSGGIEVKLALEIASQVAAGLAALHKQKLVHRDIKPANIMVSLEEGCLGTAKVIDLGLAKVVEESQSETAISIAGSFAGTPEFASPEQFAGVGVDIRSDLYALGVTIWAMLKGKTPFRGAPAEVMYQHQHVPLPLEQLKDVPQPVSVLLEVLLDKDPRRRFRSPTELLNVMPSIAGAVAEGCTITRQALQKTFPNDRKRPIRLGPDRISVASLPVTGSDVFGREEDILFLDDAWANQQINVVTIVAWAGVGKSTLVNHWLRRMAVEHYRSAELVFGWSFYRQATSRGSSSADEFLDAALTWFGDPDPRIGTAWEKGERLAKLIAHRRTLVVLDGLEPLQNPPGPQEGRVRGPALQALLRELAAFNTGLCVITTRISVGDIANHERTSVLRRDLEQLSSDAGAKLLRALGVKGHEAELRSASDEFNGHCLALTLMGSYLTDAHDGDIRRREEVSNQLTRDVRQGAHAEKVMASYQNWFGEGPELSLLRILGLFDRPVDERAICSLLDVPAIPGLTESLLGLCPSEWRTILTRLRRARLLSGKDPYHPRDVDAHPLVREYFGDQLRNQRAEAWQESNRRLYFHYQKLAPHLPDGFQEMEPLFLAVICGCNAGLFRAALHEVYLPRIQRGKVSFAANVLSARGALLAVLAHFFENGSWGSPFVTAVEGQNLTAEDQLFVLMQAAQYLPATRGLGAPEARICYERAKYLCHSLEYPRLLCLAVKGLWRYSIMTDKPSVALPMAEQVYSLAQEQDDPALIVGACNALAGTLYYLCDFESARQYAMRAIQIWRSETVQSHPEDFDTPVVGCLCYRAMSEWHLGEIAACRANMAEAISLAKELKDVHALAVALAWAAVLAYYERNPAAVDCLASEIIELSTRYNFSYFVTVGAIYRGWARSASGDTAEGIPWIEQGIRDFRATGVVPPLAYYLLLKAEALYSTDRTSEALELIKEAEATVEKFGVHTSRAELHRLRGVFLTAMGADEFEIEASFCEAIRIARAQKSISLGKRAEGTYSEYQRRKAPAECGLRLPLW
jgi:serine/threonine protein kinase/tetratricopeptide (TPR) repeat protein